MLKRSKTIKEEFAIVESDTLQDIANAIIVKGGSIEPLYPSQMSDAILSIKASAASDEEVTNEWVKPSSWPDIRTILAEDTIDDDQYFATAIVLIYFPENTTESFWNVKILQTNGYKTDEDETFVKNLAINTTYNYQFHSPGYHWIIYYTKKPTSPIFKIPIPNQSQQGKNNVNSLVKWVHGNDVDLVVTGRGIFGDCIGIKAITGINTFTDAATGTKTIGLGTFAYNQNTKPFTDDTFLMLSAQNYAYEFACNTNLETIGEVNVIMPIKDATGMFIECYSLQYIPGNFLFDQLQVGTQMFDHCVKLSYLPNTFGNALTNGTSMFNSCYVLASLPRSFTCPKLTNGTQMFLKCYSLTEIPDTFETKALKTADNMFADCTQLQYLSQNFSFANIESCGSMFLNCVSLATLPNVVDLRKVNRSGQTTALFEPLVSLVNCPTTLLANDDISFANSPNIDKNRFAKFGSDGYLDSGLISNINSLTTTKKFKISSQLKSKYTQSEWNILVQTMNDKNWTLTT